MLIDAESRYTDFEQITLAPKVAVKKLHPYFQAHTIKVLSNYPIKAILHKPNASNRLLKWLLNRVSRYRILLEVSHQGLDARQFHY